MDELAYDPFVIGAVLVYFVAVVGLFALLTALRAAGRRAAWQRLCLVLERARRMGAATFAPLAGGRHGEFLVLAKGRLVAQLPAAPDLVPITRAALVKDQDGQTGLVIEAGRLTTCVTGLEPMTRALAQLQQDDQKIEIVFRDDEAHRVADRVRTLHPGEQALVGKWLAQGEVLTDVVRGVEYEGELQAPGNKGQATLLVTQWRVGLLARTVQTERIGNTTRQTTNLSLVTYLLPTATLVTMERTVSLGRAEWRLRLDLPPAAPGAAAKADMAPVLKLTTDHTGLFVPLVLFKRPVRVVDAGVGFGRVVRETIGSALGWGILFGGFAAILAGLYYGANHTYHGRYILPAAIAGLLTPGLSKMFSLVDAWGERSRTRAALG